MAEKTQSVFTCYATGNPAPSITWIQDEEIVGIGDTLSLETQRNQSGEYRCSAENGVGLAINASAYLDVQCKYSEKLFDFYFMIIVDGTKISLTNQRIRFVIMAYDFL